MEELIGNMIEGLNSEIKQCEHSAFVNNTCTSCKKTINECDNPTTIPLHYLQPEFSVTGETMTRLRNRNFNDLIKHKKLHLVLDLDNTLIHASDLGQKLKEDDDIYEILYGMYLIKLRPGVRDFLEKASTMFEISICTMADEVYAEAVAKLLKSNKVSENLRFSRVICHEHYTNSNRKGLDIELSHERVVLIVDDCEEVWVDENKANLIKIKPYVSFNQKSDNNNDQDQDQDQELARVLDVLKTVHSVFYDDNEENYASKDVRQVLQNVRQA
ncbi:hypothetical protein SOVF_073450 [Spinacia oleracea]|nr:hypothetical protein SOVF_073450 [Spinacia oleracea]